MNSMNTFFTKRTLLAFEEQNLSWTIWCRGGNGGAFHVYDDDTVPQTPYQELMLRPFPHAVAATDYRFRSQPWTGGFELDMTVAREHTCVPTEIVVPKEVGGRSLRYRVEEGDALVEYEKGTQRLIVLPRCADCNVRVTGRR